MVVLLLIPGSNSSKGHSMINETLAKIGLTSKEAVLADIMRYEQSIGDVSEEEFNRLHPDNIDSGEFWEECIKINPLAVCGDKRVLGGSIDDIKKVNYLFTLCNGVNNQYNATKYTTNKRLRILEIGPGYGQMKQVYESMDNEYEAIDVNPLVEGVIKTDGKSIPDKEYDFIVSSNVFQHLSINQRKSYYKDIKKGLKPGGKFSFTSVIGGEAKRRYNGRAVMYNTGQFTELQTLDETFGDLQEVGLRLISYNVSPVCSTIHTINM